MFVYYLPWNKWSRRPCAPTATEYPGAGPASDPRTRSPQQGHVYSPRRHSKRGDREPGLHRQPQGPPQDGERNILRQANRL